MLILMHGLNYEFHEYFSIYIFSIANNFVHSNNLPNTKMEVQINHSKIQLIKLLNSTNAHEETSCTRVLRKRAYKFIWDTNRVLLDKLLSVFQITLHHPSLYICLIGD